jgi:hypothetical protein
VSKPTARGNKPKKTSPPAGRTKAGYVSGAGSGGGGRKQPKAAGAAADSTAADDDDDAEEDAEEEEQLEEAKPSKRQRLPSNSQPRTTALSLGEKRDVWRSMVLDFGQDFALEDANRSHVSGLKPAADM